MLEDAGFWVLLSFLTFSILFGKKIYQISAKALDKYGADIADQFKEAEALKGEAQALQERLTIRAVQVHEEITALKQEAQKTLERRKKAHAVTLEEKTRIAEKNYTEQLAVLEASMRNRILHVLTEQIIQCVRELHVPAPFSSETIRWEEVKEAFKTPQDA